MKITQISLILKDKDVTGLIPSNNDIEIRCGDGFKMSSLILEEKTLLRALAIIKADRKLNKILGPIPSPEFSKK